MTRYIDVDVMQPEANQLRDAGIKVALEAFNLKGEVALCLAAPALLEVLKALVKEAYACPRAMHDVEAARAAIAKAEQR